MTDPCRLDLGTDVAFVTIEHRLPLSSTRCAVVHLPHDVTPAEVERISRWLRTLPLESEPSSAPAERAAEAAEPRPVTAAAEPSRRQSAPPKPPTAVQKKRRGWSPEQRAAAAERMRKLNRKGLAGRRAGKRTAAEPAAPKRKRAFTPDALAKANSAKAWTPERREAAAERATKNNAGRDRSSSWTPERRAEQAERARVATAKLHAARREKTGKAAAPAPVVHRDAKPDNPAPRRPVERCPIDGCGSVLDGSGLCRRCDGDDLALQEAGLS